MGAVMDKTGFIRTLCSRLLSIALTIQALTPDALDLTLMAHDRPPGPVLVLMGFLADDKEEEEEEESHQADILASGWSPFCVSSPDHRDSPDESPDNVWEPLWPELGLARGPSNPLKVLPQAQSLLHELIATKACGRCEGRHNGQATSGKDVLSLLCRSTC
jgi:hypothetical protein